ncbi:MAG: hypothetical protein Q8K36_03360, partial [Alphaproteobacteria bacterium]|nr:hypothetical protein [Alphaproteobacteria bacterium]
ANTGLSKSPKMIEYLASSAAQLSELQDARLSALLAQAQDLNQKQVGAAHAQFGIVPNTPQQVTMLSSEELSSSGEPLLATEAPIISEDVQTVTGSDSVVETPEVVQEANPIDEQSQTEQSQTAQLAQPETAPLQAAEVLPNAPMADPSAEGSMTSDAQDLAVSVSPQHTENQTLKPAFSMGDLDTTAHSDSDDELPITPSNTDESVSDLSQEVSLNDVNNPVTQSSLAIVPPQAINDSEAPISLQQPVQQSGLPSMSQGQIIADGPQNQNDETIPQSIDTQAQAFSQGNTFVSGQKENQSAVMDNSSLTKLPKMPLPKPMPNGLQPIPSNGGVVLNQSFPVKQQTQAVEQPVAPQTRLASSQTQAAPPQIMEETRHFKEDSFINQTVSPEAFADFFN